MNNVKKHLMTGVSYMIPIVVAGGILLSLGVIIGEETAIGEQLVNYGVWTLGLMVPMIAGYISYSIADRPGVAVGLASGVFASELGTGYIGGILVGFFAGWITNQLKKIPMHHHIAVIKPIMIIPLLGIGASALFMYIISIPLTPAMEGLEKWLVSLEGSNLLFLGFIIAAMMAFDMGSGVIKFADKGKHTAKKTKSTGNLVKIYGVKEYIKDVERITGRKIPDNQKILLKKELREVDYSGKLPKGEIIKHRKEFQRKKDKLIDEWEKNTGQKWPTYSKPVLSKRGRVYIEKGDRYDAHHIIKNEHGGPNEWYNIHPAKRPNEHQSGIHRKDGPEKKLFK